MKVVLMLTVLHLLGSWVWILQSNIDLIDFNGWMNVEKRRLINRFWFFFSIEKYNDEVLCDVC